ncbi:hypothetical protein Fmac_013501 [Flemingia macrophylla]|uniref:mTERF protein n=1 Tax=Flemingia macrophylla TaxID=520843 RepID=A0ABD1MTB0_9FABA
MILFDALRARLRVGSPVYLSVSRTSKGFSTTSDGIGESFTISYLTASCGFSPEAALKASKRLRLQSPQKPDAVISFFRSHGFSHSQIHHIFGVAPDLMTCNPTKRLLPKFNFLSSKGASPDHIILIATKCPRILRYSLRNYIAPAFHLLRSFCPSDRKALAVLLACPNFIGDCRVTANVNTLQRAGLAPSSIRYLLSTRPSVLCSDLKTVIHEVKLLGFDPSKLGFTVALLAKRAVSKSLWDAKVDAFRRWGWSEDEVLAAFRNQPSVMLRSMDKINGVLAFWMGRLGWDHSALVASPTLFSYSLEKRVIPRALVVQHLISRGLIKKGASLVTPFSMTDEAFLQKYVKCFEDETSTLLELYQGKGT